MQESKTTDNGRFLSGNTSNVWLASGGNINYRSSGISAGSGTTIATMNTNSVQINGNTDISGTLTVNSINLNETGSNGIITRASGGLLTEHGSIKVSGNTLIANSIQFGTNPNNNLGIIYEGTTGNLTKSLIRITGNEANGHNFENINTVSATTVSATTVSTTGNGTIGGTLTINGNQLDFSNNLSIYTPRTNTIYIGTRPTALSTSMTDTNNYTLGYDCLKKLSTIGGDNTRGNVAIGLSALQEAARSYLSVAIGYEALNFTTDSERCVAIGQSAGRSITGSCKNNTFLGALTDFNNANSIWENSTAVGYGALITASNQIKLGTSSETVKIDGSLNVLGSININNTGSRGLLFRDNSGNLIENSVIKAHADGALYTSLPAGRNSSPTIKASKGNMSIAFALDLSENIWSGRVANNDHCIYWVGTTADASAYPDRNLVIAPHNTTSEYGITIFQDGGVSSTSFSADSDYRLKENIQTISSDQFTVDELRPVSYTLKSNQKPALGFIAHEIQEHVPSAVSGEKDGDSMQSVDYNQIIPILVKEIQELKKRVAYLEQNQK